MILSMHPVAVFLLECFDVAVDWQHFSVIASLYLIAVTWQCFSVIFVHAFSSCQWSKLFIHCLSTLLGEMLRDGNVVFFLFFSLILKIYVLEGKRQLLMVFIKRNSEIYSVKDCLYKRLLTSWEKYWQKLLFWSLI